MNAFFRRMTPMVATGAIALAAGLFASDTADAKMEALKIGENMPDFTLKDTGGNEHSLKQYAGKIVVFNFCSQECPYSRSADPTINALAETYGDKGIVFLGVNSNKDLTAEEIQPYIEKADIPYPILKDEANKLADAVGARVTPEIYIIDAEGKLVYHGAPDNRSGPNSTATEFYLKDALASLTAGEPIEKTTAKAWGCGINRAS